MILVVVCSSADVSVPRCITVCLCVCHEKKQVQDLCATFAFLTATKRDSESSLTGRDIGSTNESQLGEKLPRERYPSKIFYNYYFKQIGVETT